MEAHSERESVLGACDAGMIAKTGLEIGWEAIKELSDSAVEEEVPGLLLVRGCSATLRAAGAGDGAALR